MQIVIDIPNDNYQIMLSKIMLACYGCKITELPKEHGRLIGADKLKAEVFRACMDEHFMPMKFLDCDTITEIIDNAQTIIEADKEGA